MTDCHDSTTHAQTRLSLEGDAIMLIKRSESNEYFSKAKTIEFQRRSDVGQHMQL